MEQVIFWLVLLIVLVLIEIATLGLTTIWFAGGSLAALIAAAFGAPLYLQITLFIAVSAVLLFFTRPLAMKYFNGSRVKTNAESLIGRRAVVKEEIDNLKASGLVSVRGQDWTARSVRDDAVIPKGSVVDIRAISGVKLIVEERKGGE
ncbi:MAG TPA: NfeD family protein [Candidatus Eisenbergiella pullistercoris]|uniref:NfeD family protein n=1 Tax=Candidatus Eisenbergiella pullistercoris TaxID=2838555 RepID=A0A9D1YQ27_9FIRM|nr:NfeD family protein [Candidatus Eisenbergiella pullistercoris]